ncbi:hypothetical protein TNCV_376801 [Trichonephila clavipes]|nr:hypothetical protein TNCV_376801 [Trichonephila clavipes]
MTGPLKTARWAAEKSEGLRSRKRRGQATSPPGTLEVETGISFSETVKDAFTASNVPYRVPFGVLKKDCPNNRSGLYDGWGSIVTPIFSSNSKRRDAV